jgi:hypothetical protein
LLLVAVIGSVVAAYPILGNYFALDDFGSFYEIANFGPWDFIGETAAGHMYLVRNSIVYLWFLLFGVEATWITSTGSAPRSRAPTRARSGGCARSRPARSYASPTSRLR